MLININMQLLLEMLIYLQPDNLYKVIKYIFLKTVIPSNTNPIVVTFIYFSTSHNFYFLLPAFVSTINTLFYFLILSINTITS